MYQPRRMLRYQVQLGGCTAAIRPLQIPDNWVLGARAASGRRVIKPLASRDSSSDY